jgi:hypothetical protein
MITFICSRNWGSMLFMLRLALDLDNDSSDKNEAMAAWEPGSNMSTELELVLGLMLPPALLSTPSPSWPPRAKAADRSSGETERGSGAT